MSLVITDTFQKSLAKLDKPDATSAKVAVYDFHETPLRPGANLHPVKGARDQDMWSFRVNRDVRIIVNKAGDDTVLCYVDHHDQAYDWAERHVYRPHSVTGEAQIIEVVERTEEIVRPLEREPAVFGAYEDDYLVALGVPDEWLVPLKEVGESRALDVLERLPAGAQERLLQLMSGEPVPTPVPVDGVSPVAQPQSSRGFRIIDTHSELRRALEAPWAQWAVFLHPDQRALVERSYSGPALVTGTAGTGKTVVAIHRAARLAREAEGPVLLTSYSRTLAGLLKDHAEAVLPAEESAWANLEVSNLHTIAMRELKRAGEDFEVGDGHRVRALLRTAAKRHRLDADFAQSEWDAIVQPWGIETWDEYLEAPRRGRGRPLGARERKALWAAFADTIDELRTRGLMTWGQVTRRAAEVVAEVPPYRHVIADECQDLGPTELQFVRALAPQSHDDIFLCGDAGQQIYRRGFSWLSAGIDVRGRSRRLKVNYRTTEQIRKWADGLLESVPGDASTDGEEEENRSTVSLLTGPEPDLIGAEDTEGEIEIVATWLRDRVGDGFEPGHLALFARTNKLLEERALLAIEKAGLRAHHLSDDDAAPVDRVAVGTMHRAKGLEFRAVSVLGCDSDIVPFRRALDACADPGDRDAVLRQERNLVYVACTRAQRRLLVTWVGERSELVAPP